jgi:hypothetical protein
VIDGQLISISLFSGAGGLDIGMDAELQEFFNKLVADKSGYLLPHRHPSFTNSYQNLAHKSATSYIA